MNTPSYQEDHASQIPALQLLQNLGYTYLPPEEALRLRGGKTGNVLLEDILFAQLRKLSRFEYLPGEEYPFSDGNLREAIRVLRNLPLPNGLTAAAQYAYNQLMTGPALEETIRGNRQSYHVTYIDWERPERNVYHVTEEFEVLRSGRRNAYRPDLVLFVNGIPLVVIECKRPSLTKPLDKAIAQHQRNQKEDGIRPLYAYSQLVLALCANDARYATTGTEAKFWSNWEEKYSTETARETDQARLKAIVNRPLPPAQNDLLFGGRFAYVRDHFELLARSERAISKQDRLLYQLCRPERLLELARHYVLFDGGTKKVARYQQYFAIQKTLDRIQNPLPGEARGGVIWHTQGSGKSLTMVLLAQGIAEAARQHGRRTAVAKPIRHPKIVIVTDRTDLDNQIRDTFRKCDVNVERASTGSKLFELLARDEDTVVTTVINKFEAALKSRRRKNQERPVFTDENIFVLIDEGHRTQYGTFNVAMERTFPNACFLAFTGTPLRNKEKDTARKFGGLIDTYTVDQAVRDGAVVPLLYEGRHALQEVNQKPLDKYFSKATEDLTDYQRADLKRKHARADQLNVADQKIYAIAHDISEHYCANWQGSGFKGQLVCANKASAIKYLTYLREIGDVSAELIISPPDTREGDDSAYRESTDTIKNFWKEMMDRYGSPTKYEKHIINAFKHAAEPEIIVVVDKLLTGFDAPRNIVLYLTRSLREHTLLQAIARVNRVAPNKTHGYILDYYGILVELDKAIKTYTDFQDFEAEDLAHAVTNIQEEIARLPQVHSELHDFFKTVPNKMDAAGYEHILRDEAKRFLFYDKFNEFARLLKMGLSIRQWVETTPESLVDRYKSDLKFFVNLRNSVRNVYSDTVDFKKYQRDIQKLIDRHVSTDEVRPITQLVDIFDEEKLAAELDQLDSTRSRADTIASRTAKHINERMEEDPALYKRFSDMLNEVIADFLSKRISEAEYLKRVQALKQEVRDRGGSELPTELRNRPEAAAFYHSSQAVFTPKLEDAVRANALALETGLGIDALMREHLFERGQLRIDWKNNQTLTGRLEIALGDFLLDEIRGRDGLVLDFGEVKSLVAGFMEVARVRFQ